MVETDKNDAALAGIIGGLIALLYATILVFKVLNAKQGTPKMKEIAASIQEGAYAFLKREYTIIAGFVLVVMIILIIAIDWQTGLCFFIGAVVSGVAGIAGMMIAVRSNLRTAAAAQDGLNEALRVAFNSGSVMGFTVVGSGLFTMSILSIIFDEDYNRLAGFGMGASSIALFARVGGGIFTKAADVGTDLVGKVEAGIPEDDPRNPGVIADNVGDNVGDVAGMGADLFESYVGSIIAAAALGGTDFAGSNGVALPIWVSAAGIVCSIVGALCIRTKEAGPNEDVQENLLFAMRFGTVVAGILICGASAIVVDQLDMDWGLYGCILLGLVAGISIGFCTEYCTSFSYWPVLTIVKAANTGPATVIIQGLAVGMWSCVPPVIIICATILGCYELGGVYGVAIAPVGMLATLGVTLATDAYGPVADNAGGIAEMAELPPDVRDRTDALDALGNTTAATGKGFAIGSAVLTALALLAAFTEAVGLEGDRVDLVADAEVLPGILFGTMLPFFFASMTMTAVGKAAQQIITEIRRQFREIEGLLEGHGKADYARCVDISTAASLKEMIFPSLLAIITPVIVGTGFGAKALAGLLSGSITGGFLLAVTMANSGGAWDNAKKYCEANHGKRTEVHKALVCGDTVGDPFKDTSGPSLNILLKLMAIVSLVLAPVFENPEYWWALVIFFISLVLGGILWQFVVKDATGGDVFDSKSPGNFKYNKVEDDKVVNK